MKERKKDRNRSLILAALLVFSLVSLFAACGGGPRSGLEVVIELPDPGSLKFEKYDKILYKDLVIEGIPEGYDPASEIETFFLVDLGRVIEKKIEKWDGEKHGEMSPEGLLIISGKLKIAIKSRSKIEDVKEGKKKSKKKFVTVQHWDMTMTLDMKDVADGKSVYNEDFKAKLANADAKTVKFNFENLFFKVTNRFTKKVTRTKKMQRRHLLN